MPSFEESVRRVPGARTALHIFSRLISTPRLIGRTTEEVFTGISRGNRWRGKFSISGTGSDLVQTERIRLMIPELCRSFGIKTLLDIPCGDFKWMQHVDLSELKYTGADIVGDLVEENARFLSDRIHFRKLNLIEDELPAVDMVICRDCIVHLSFRDALAAFRNISKSRAKYLLTTTFPETRRNTDILTGQWRRINLQIAPFSFPAPLELINEGCTEWDGSFKDKSLAL